MLVVSDFFTYFPIEFYVQLLCLAMVAIFDHLCFFYTQGKYSYFAYLKKIGKHKTRQYYTQFWNMAGYTCS